MQSIFLELYNIKKNANITAFDATQPHLTKIASKNFTYYLFLSDNFRKVLHNT